MPDANRLKKLKWLCRRGMKELDVLLEAFVQENTALLMNGDCPELEALLLQEDDILWDWIQNPAHSNASDFQNLLIQIRHDAISAH